MALIAVILDLVVAEKIVRHLGLGTRAPAAHVHSAAGPHGPAPQRASVRPGVRGAVGAALRHYVQHRSGYCVPIDLSGAWGHELDAVQVAPGPGRQVEGDHGRVG